MANLYHIIKKDEWLKVKNQDEYSPESLKSDGFIHCSKTDQFIMIANSLYKHQKNIVVLKIIESLIKPKVKFEPPLEAPKSGLIFPHIYGPLNLDAVDKVLDLKEDDSGHFYLPEDYI